MARAKRKPVKGGSSQGAAEARRLSFVEHYIANGENATAAGLAVGFSEKSAASQASRLLKHAKVQQLLNERRAALAAKYHLTTESVIKVLAQVVHFDPRKLFDAHGNVKPIHELDDDTAAAIASFEVEEITAGKGEDLKHVGYTKKFKAWDKNSAIDKAMKHLGLFQKDNEQVKPEIPAESTSMLDAARRIAFTLAQGAAAAKKAKSS